MNLENSPRILSQPIQLHWAGWRSDTFTLQRAGWQLAANQDIEFNKLRFFLKHPGINICGTSQSIDFDYLRSVHLGERDYLRDIILPCQLASEYIIDEVGCVPYSVQAIDATPTYTEAKMISLKDAKFFTTVNTDIQQVTLEKATLAEVLDFALQKQKPRQDDIRRELLRRDHLESIKRNTELRAELRLVS
ncbi:hypothetical protein LCGC14_2996690 [marine sediment metagenome]|uniref:Uncharacterized protein n=1 Tax=marine sediment metagenome TaxID=412755 RepID=A0A0F8X2P5_9ZZZZ